MSNNIDVKKIMEKWAEFSEWDPDQRKFNLMSYNYFFHRNNEIVFEFYKKYPQFQNLGLLQFKNILLYYLKDAKISLFDAIENSYENLKPIVEILEMFNSDIIKEIENSFFDKIQELHKFFNRDYAIGDANSLDYMNALSLNFENFSKLKIEVYQKGGEIKPVQFCTDIQIFNTLAECLLILEKSEDKVYLCYINQNNTLNGYFGVFIKSNGNIFSVNERIRETYVGQHGHSRNNRWSENKAFDLFPYSVFKFEEYDYLGYASKHIVDKDSLNFYDIDPDEKNNLIVLFMFITLMFFNTTLDNDIEVVYSNYFIKNNLQNYFELKGTELIPFKDSAIMKTTQSLVLDITADDIKNATKHEEYKFTNSKQIFIDLYASDFKIDMSKLLVDNSLLKLKSGTADKDDVPQAEFVTTKKGFEEELYYEGRKQLANYIKEEMKKELEKFSMEFTGKPDDRACGEKWYKQVAKKNKDRIVRFLVQGYIKKLNGEKDNRFTINDGYGWGGTILNTKSSFRAPYYWDDINDKPCNIYISFEPNNYLDIEELIGEEVPKILKGFSNHWVHNGNSILDTVDYVSEVQTPFEARGSFTIDPYRENFKICIGFSKSGLKKYIKDNNII